MPPSTESTAGITGPNRAGPRTVVCVVVTDCDGSISRVGEKTVPLLPLKISPLPLIVAFGVVLLEVEGPALKNPPATELPITTALPLSKFPPLWLGKVVPTTEMVPKLAKAPVEALAVPELAQV